MIYGSLGAIVAAASIFAPSFLMGIAMTPVMDRLKSSAIFQRATEGIISLFVGLLFFVTVKFALAVPWDAVRMFLACATAVALVKKADIFYVVPVVALIAVLVL